MEAIAAAPAHEADVAALPHKFKIGLTVQFHPATGDHYATRGSMW
jgi:hypothetical protein